MIDEKVFMVLIMFDSVDRVYGFDSLEIFYGCDNGTIPNKK